MRIALALECLGCALGREILDEVVRYAHGSSFTIIMIRGALEPYPESEFEKDKRRTFYEKLGRWPTGYELDGSER